MILTEMALFQIAEKSLSMAAGGTGLAGTDRVTDQLISRVASHVILAERPKFATEELGLSFTQHDNIVWDEQNAEKINRKVSQSSSTQERERETRAQANFKR